MEQEQQIATLNSETLLEFAQSQCPKVKRMDEVGSRHSPFVFSTQRGAKILAPMWVNSGNEMGFRSFLQVTGKNPRFLINGQSSTGTKCLEFFGESGPKLHFRNNALFEPKNVWGVLVDACGNTPSDAVEELARQDNPIDAINVITSRFEGGSDDFLRKSAIASVLTVAKVPVEEAVPMVLDAPAKEARESLRMQYKAKAPLLKELENNGIPIEETISHWCNCEYPQSITRELLAMGLEGDEVLGVLENAYAESNVHDFSKFKEVVESIIQDSEGIKM
jgi:hypothetical protein